MKSLPAASPVPAEQPCMGEFDLIARYFTRATPGADLGVGDDAALVTPTAGQQIVIAADTLVEGRHFFPGTDAYALGWKALAVNLSDMAAMGATPRWFTLCLTLPGIDEAWLARFAAGLFALADRYGVDLIGGDTTRGPLAFSIQILGEVAAGTALRRDAAQAGDDVWLSGATGAAALAVAQRSGQAQLSDDDLAFCAKRLDFPEPRLALGRALLGIVRAAIDVSDGLLADLGHICERSALGATVQLALLPFPALSPALRASPPMQQAVLAGGDDYELCFTAPVAVREQIIAVGQALGVSLTRIGQMHAGQGVRVLDEKGVAMALAATGFKHFG